MLKFYQIGEAERGVCRQIQFPSTRLEWVLKLIHFRSSHNDRNVWIKYILSSSHPNEMQQGYFLFFVRHGILKSFFSPVGFQHSKFLLTSDNRWQLLPLHFFKQPVSGTVECVDCPGKKQSPFLTECCEGIPPTSITIQRQSRPRPLRGWDNR